MDIARWLRNLGLQQYQAAFRDNAIDDAVLPSLTAEDLKDPGVGLVGHRRKLLDAIAALRGGTSTDAAPRDVLPILDNAATDSAERRQVTVMFSDLVGSTALAKIRSELGASTAPGRPTASFGLNQDKYLTLCIFWRERTRWARAPTS
jgi:hypothetical protein